jgi:hypothetical protein
VPVYPAPGSDKNGNGKDDFWEEFIKQHPELDGIEVPDAPEVPTVGEVAIPLAVAATILIVVGVCVFTAAGCLAAIGARLALLAVPAAAEAGAAAISTLIMMTIAGLAALIGWNIFGDPHLATPDGLAYDLQSVGEFHLLEAPELGIDVQARFTASGPNLSLFNTVATEINDTRVELGNGTLKIDGQPVTLANNASFDLGDGAAVMRNGRFYSVLWPGHGDRLTMMWSGSNVGFHLPQALTTRGLLGNSNGNPHDDLALRDGTPLPSDAAASVLHGRFADSWRITEAESMFAYPAGQSTASYTNRSFPANVITIDDFTEAEIAAASQTCQDAGVVPGPQFEDCVFDVVATGDATYAQAAAEVTDVLTDSASHFFDDTGNLAEDFEGAVGANFVSPRYAEDIATTRVAGPLFDTPGYRMTARSVTRHKSIRLRADLYAYGNIGDDNNRQTMALKVDGVAVGGVDFEGTTGPTLTGGLTGTIERTGVNTTANGTPFTKYALDVTLPHSAASANIEFFPSFFRGVLNTSLGIDNIKMTLEVPAANTFDVSLPLIVPSDQAATAQGAGALETAGAQDEYRFDLAAPAVLVFDLRTCLSDLAAVLVNTTTGVRTSLTSSCQDAVTPVMPAGAYRLDVQASKLGSYTFDLFVKPDPQVFDLGQLGSSTVSVSNGAPATGAGNLETKASEDDYRFTLSSAQSVAFTSACSGAGTTGGYLSWRLVKDDGSNTAVTSSMYCPSQVISNLAAGDYRLLVKPAYEVTGTYAFDLMVVPAGQAFDLGALGSAPVTVSDGVPAAGAGNLETRVSQDELRFSLDSARTVFFDFTGSSISPFWQLLRSDGTTVMSSSGNYRAEGLPAGDYRVLLGTRTSIGTAGKYALKLTTATTQAFDLGALGATSTTVSNGAPAAGAGNLESKASQDEYRFSLPAAGSVAFTSACSGAGATGGYLSWRLVKDDGSNTTVTSSMYCPSQVLSNLAAGDYRLIAKPAYEVTGTYSLDLMVAPDIQAFDLGALGSAPVTVSDGVPAAGAGNLETRVSQDELRFSLDSARTVFFDFTGSAISPYWQLLRSDGTTVMSSSGNYRAENLPAGEYRVLLGTRTSIGTAGKYQLTLTTATTQAFDLGALGATATTVSNGVPGPGAGNLDSKAAQDDYRFSLTAAGSVAFTSACSGAATTGGYLSWRLVKDDGSNTTVTSSMHCPSQVLSNLAAGNYRLIAKPAYEVTGTYAFDLMLVPDTQVFALETLNSSTMVSDGVPAAGAGNLETRVSQDELRFTMPSAQTVAFDFAGSAVSPYWQLLRADGTTVVSTSGNYRAEGLAAGDYRVLLGTRTSIGTAGKYQLKLTPASTQTFDLGALGATTTTVSSGVPGPGAGNLETKASEDEYRFTLSSAQSVAFTSACSGAGTTGGYLSWRLVKDDGSSTAASSMYCPSQVVPDLAAGDYRLLVKPAYEVTGTYSLDLMVVPAGQAFDLGALGSAPVTVSEGVPAAGAGNLETRVSQDELRFSLDSARTVFFDFTGSAISPYWQLLRSDGTAVMSTSGNYRAENLPAGEYRVLLGTRTSIGTAGKYTLKLTTASTQAFDLGALGASTVSVANGVPGPGAGNLESKASQDEYRFSLPAAGSVAFTSACSGTGATGGYLSWRLVKDDGSNTTVTSSMYCPSQVIPDLAAGDYRLIAKPAYEVTGTYSLDLMVVPAAQAFDLGGVASAVTVSDGVPAAGAGNLETRVSQDELRFTMPSAQTVFFDFTGSSISPYWQLLRSDGTTVMSSSGNYRAEGLPAGAYRVLLGTRTSIGTAGKYQLTLTPASTQTFDLGPLGSSTVSVANGLPAAGAGNLESKASQDDYRFSLTAAGSVAFTSACSGAGTTGGYLSWRLVKDDGSNTTVTSSMYCPSQVISNLAAGNYRLIAKPAYEVTGTYSLDLMVVPAIQLFTLGTLNSSMTVSDGVPAAGAGNLETQVSQDDYQLTLSSPTALSLDFTGSVISPYWQLLRADGTTVVSSSGNYRAEGLAAGDYRILLGTRTSIGTAGKYTLKLTTASTQVFDLGPLGSSTVSVSNGVPGPGAGNLETKAAQDDYRFTLSSAQSVALTSACSGAGTTGGYLSWRLVKDDGSNTAVTSSMHCPSQVISNLAAGDYRLIAKPAYEVTGTYSLDLMVVPAVHTFDLGGVASAVTVSDGVPAAGAGNLETRVSQDELRFSLDSARTVFFDFTGSAITPYLQLLRADGTTVMSISGNYRAENLPAGDYRVLLGTRTSIGTAGKYTLKLTTASTQVFDLGALGATATTVSNGAPAAGAGNLESKAAQDEYRFTLSSAQSVALTSACSGTGTTGGYLSWRLVKDDGSNTTVTSSVYCPSQVIPNLAAGNYRLIAKPAYEITGTYSLDLMVVPDIQVFTLGTLSSSTTVSDGVPAAGAGNLETRVSQDELRFSLDSARTVFFDFTGSAITPYLQLLRGDGTTVMSISGNYRAENLPAGDYRVLLGTRTSIGTAGKYQLTLTTATTQAFDLGPLGSSTVSVSNGLPAAGAGNLESKAAQDDYRFTLSSAQSLALTSACSGAGATGGYLSWRLVKDDGSNTTVTSSVYCPSQVIPNLAAGNYRLVAKPAYEITGTYAFDLMVVPAAQAFDLGGVASAVTVSDGVPAAGAGNLETRVSQDELRFNLDSARTVFFDFTGSAISPFWQLLRADGTTVMSSSGNYRAEGLAAGDYRILLGTRTSIGTAGKYQLTLTAASTQVFDLGALSATATTVSNGAPAAGAGNLESKAAQDEYRFTLSAAQSLSLTSACSGAGTTGGYLSWRLVKDDGSNTTVTSSVYCPSQVVSNLAAGNYRLIAKPAYEVTGTYSLSFQAKTP